MAKKNEVIDYSGGDDWDEFNDDFLSENEQNFLEASEVNSDTSNSKFDSFFAMILTGVTTSHNLKKKSDLLVEESAQSDFKRSMTIDEDIMMYAKKMYMANKTVGDLAMKLYEYCEENNKFWHNCSVNVYKNHFQELKDFYLLKYPNSEIIDFLKSEYLYFFSDEFNGLNATHNSIAPYDNKLQMVDYISRLSIDTFEFFSIVKQRKLDFVADEIQKAGFTIVAVKAKKNIKVNILKTNEANTIEEIPDEPLEISNLPSFNLEERFELFRRLGFEKSLIGLDTTKKNKNMLLGLIMGFSVDNAKKLLDGTYKSNLDEEKRKLRKADIIEKVDDLLFRNKLKL